MKINIINHPDYTPVQQKLIEALAFSLGCSLEVYYNPNVDEYFDKIEAAVLDEFKISKADLYHPTKDFAEYRQVLVYLMKESIPVQDKYIAIKIGKSRATVLHSYKKIADLISINDAIKINIDNCIKAIKNHD